MIFVESLIAIYVNSELKLEHTKNIRVWRPFKIANNNINY